MTTGKAWKVKRLQEVAQIRLSGVDKKASTSEAPIRLCNYTDVYHNDSIRGSMSFMHATATQSEIDRFTLKRGDVLITKDSEAADDIAVPAVVEEDLPGVLCGYHLALLRPDSEMLDGFFLAQILRDSSIRRHFASLANGVTRFGLNLESIGHAKLNLPDVTEQRKIAQILCQWDRTAALITSLIEKKLSLRRTVMQQMLYGEKRLPGFSEEWREVGLKKLLKHVFRPVKWAPDIIFNLISIRRRSGGLFHRASLRGDEYKTTDLHEIHEGDFLISKRQVSHGALAMVRTDFHGCHVSKEYTILENRDPKQLHMPFFDWLSRTKRMWWLTYVASNGVVIEKLIFDPKDFLKFSIRIPPTLAEQERIVEVLETCDREIGLHRRQFAAIREQKRGLMQKLLTGEVRVKV